MAYQRQTWTARVGTGLNRFRDTLSGTYFELINLPAQIVVEGTPFSAERMNHIEEGIAALSETVSGGVTALTGSSTFNGTAGRVISHTLGSTGYVVAVTPLADTAGTLGEFYVSKAADSFTVYNTGSFRGSFDYAVMKGAV